jgi:hypothetical protein
MQTIAVAELCAGRLASVVRVSVADPALSEAMQGAITKALREATEATGVSTPRVVRLRTRKRFADLGPEGVAGAIVVVQVTDTNARHLPELIEAVRAAGAAGAQLVWDGESPPRALVERHLFTVLERARATPGGPPVVLASSKEPSFALQVLTAKRAGKVETRS